MSTLIKDAEVLAELSCKLSQVCKRQEDALAAKFRLAPSEFRFLKLYASMGTVLTIKDFRKVLNLTSRQDDSYHFFPRKKKFLKRRTQKEDKRFVSIILLPKVDPLIETMKKTSGVFYKSLLEKIDPNARETMVKTLSLVVGGI